MSHVEAIQKNIDVLQRCTTINLYVIDFLRAKDVIDEEQESDLKAESSLLKQRILLYHWLKKVSSDKYETFLQVMKDAEQEHVTNLLTGSTEDDHLPLSDARYTRLVKIRYKMAEVTQIDIEVIAELRRLKAVSMTDAEEIRAEKVDYAKVSKLISAIMRRSNYSYVSFQEVLRKTLQLAAADFLSEGVMLELHMNDNRPDLDGPLAQTFNGVIENGTSDDAEINPRFREMNGLGLYPVRAIPGQSIVIFIYCKTVRNAVNFTQLFNSGRLQHILESIFNRLLRTIEPHNKKTINSILSLEDKEIVTLEEFTGIEGCIEESFTRQRQSVGMILCGCDATTQTGRRRPRKRKKKKPKKYGLSSLVHMDEEDTGGELRNLQAELEKPPSWSGIRSSVESQLEQPTFRHGGRYIPPMSRKAMKQMENPTSKPSIPSKAESQLDKASTVLSIQTSQTASAYGRMTISPKVRRPEVIKPSDQDQGSSASSDKSKILKLHGIQDKSEYCNLIQQLDRIRKENDRLKKLLEHQTEIGELPQRYKSDPVLLQTIKIEDGEDKKTINGLAILDKDLFAVSQASSEVEVYDSIKYIFSRRWNFRNLIAPKDIGSCSINKCLYILDFKGDNQSKEILRVDPNGKLLRNWSTGSDWADCLSVTYESNIILAVFNKNKLTEYSPDGQLIREIDLSSDAGIRNPFHAIKLSNGDFIVSHGEYGMNTVCIVDAVGKPKKPLCEKCKLFIGEMNGSLHLSVDGNGFVMVADRESNRVLLLDSDLEFKREILSERRHGLQYPERILLDESNGRLFVAYNDWKKGRILVFQFK